MFDVLVRLLRLRHAKVTYVRNITDVDDKINIRAAERGISINDLCAETIKTFHNDTARLGSFDPDIEPRATHHIDEMQAMITTLIEKGHAYEADGHVLFQVSTMDAYGALSKRSMDDMIAGARVEVAPYKREAADFILWKPSDYAFDLITETNSKSIPSLYLYSPLREYIASCSKGKRVDWIKNRFIAANPDKIIKYLGPLSENKDLSKTSVQASLYWCYFAKKFNDFSLNGNIVALNSLLMWIFYSSHIQRDLNPTMY